MIRSPALIAARLSSQAARLQKNQTERMSTGRGDRILLGENAKAFLKNVRNFRGDDANDVFLFVRALVELGLPAACENKSIVQVLNKHHLIKN